MGELVQELETLLKEKRCSCQRFTDPIQFARVADAAMAFEGGLVFSGSRHIHKPIIFIGIYRWQSLYVVTITCQNKLKVPDTLVSKACVYLNSWNVGSKGMWTSQSEQIRFYTVNFLPKTGYRNLVWLLIQRTDASFKEAMGKLVEWMLEDPDFQRNYRIYKSEFAYFASHLPADTVQEANYKDMTDAAQRTLKALGFSRYTIMEKYGKSIITFTLTNEGTSTGTNWKMFPVLITIGPTIVEVKIVFMMNERQIEFNDLSHIEELCKIIAFVNGKIAFGYFSYDSEKKHVYLLSRSLYCLLDKREYGQLVEQTLASAISCYKIYGYGFVELFSKTPIEEIFGKCLEREQYFMRREKTRGGIRPEEQEDGEESDADEDSEEYSGTNSSDSEEGNKVAESQAPVTPLPSMDDARAQAFKQLLPPQLLNCFCLSAKIASEMKLVDWKSVDDPVPKIVDGYMRLKRLGLSFTSIPFDSTTLNADGNMYLLPTFPTETMKIEGEKRYNPEEEEQYKFVVHSELLPYLAKNVSKEKHATVATLQVFRAMQDIDYISPSRFKKSNLVDPEDKIGKGGFGDVFKNVMDGSIEVALKSITSERAAKRPSRDYLSSEFRLLQLCTHRNVVRVFGYTKHQSQVLLVLEHCAQGGLHKYLPGKALSLRERLEIALGVADGLLLIHSKSICHFDIKPQNILLTMDLVPKICDFGLSQVFNRSHPCKKVGCTMLYGAPEQVGKRNPGPPADVWAFGILIYYILFAQYPFEYIKQHFLKTEAERKKLYDEIAERRRKPLFTREFEVGNPRLVHLIRSCLNYEPSERPALPAIVRTLQLIMPTE